MESIWRLVQGELYKYQKAKLFWLLGIAVVVVMLAVTYNEYSDYQRYLAAGGEKGEPFTWEESETNLIQYATEDLENDYYSPLQKEQIRRRIAIAEYRLDKNIPKDIYKNMWWFFNDNSFDWVMRIVILFVIIGGCANIAGEYTNKTMGQMLLLPYRRWKILFAKYLAMGIYGLGAFVLVFLLGIASGAFIFGTSGLGNSVVLFYGSSISEMSIWNYSMITVLDKLVELVFVVSITGMLAILFQSFSVSVVVAMVVGFVATPVSLFIAQYYPAFNYLPFNNLSFKRYLDFGMVMPTVSFTTDLYVTAGITIATSISIVVLAVAACFAVSFYVFARRDER